MKNSIPYKNRETYSLGVLLEALNLSETNCNKNNKNINTVPVVISIDRKEYSLFSVATCFSKEITIKLEAGERLKTIVPDKRPIYPFNEYWSSRGPSNSDCSGFVPSKEAGERLDRLVSVVLENNEHKSWLDYREYEPNWIQYKFSAEEFDVELLHKMTTEEGEYKGMISLEVLMACKRNNKNNN